MDRNNARNRNNGHSVPGSNDRKSQTVLYTVPSRGYNTGSGGKRPAPRPQPNMAALTCPPGRVSEGNTRGRPVSEGNERAPRGTASGRRYDYDAYEPPPQRDTRYARDDRQYAKPKKSGYSALFAIIICTGVVVCVAAFALIFTSLTQNVTPGAVRPTPRPGPGLDLGAGAVRREVTDTALIRAVDTDANTFTLYGIASGETYFATWTGSTEMRDRHGNSLVPGQFRPGDVVDVRHWMDDTVLSSIQQNGEARTFTDISGLAVTMSEDPNNPVHGRIRHGNLEFVFGQELISLYRDEPFDLANLSAIDRVTMRTFRQTLLFLEIIAGSGEIEVIFNEHIQGGNITIGIGASGTYARLSEDRVFTVAEGIHQVTIRGDNIEDINRDVLVRSGEATVIDLENVQFRSGVISFSSNIDNLHLTINDQAWDIGQNFTAMYGTFAIRATSFGYQNYENTFVLNQPFVNYNIVMNPIPTPPPPTPRVDTRAVTFITNVGGVSIYVDGYFAGATSDVFGQTEQTLTVQVEVGTRMITLRRDGHHPIVDSAIFVGTDVRQHSQRFILHPIR